MAFRYHGGVPVEHPLCPGCGSPIEWSYQFDEGESIHAPEEMAGWIRLDEDGFPVDRSPRVVALEALIDAQLEAHTGSSIRLENVGGAVDIELQVYAEAQRGVFGARAVANVGRAVFSVALLELLMQLNQRLELGAIVPDTSAYTAPQGTVTLFPFGTEVGLYFQCVIPEAELESGAWVSHWQTAQRLAAMSAQIFAQMARLDFDVTSSARVTLASGPELEGDEFAPGRLMQLENVDKAILEPLLRSAPEAEEIEARIDAFLETLALSAPLVDGAAHFALDSARVVVSLDTRAGRLLVRFHSVLLSDIDLDDLKRHEPQLAPRLLTTLNDQIRFGRCVLEPETEEARRWRIVYETTLLAVDLDLSEFAVTLAIMAEQADRMDNILQVGFGGLRADQLEAMEAHKHDRRAATDVAPLLEAIASGRLPGPRKIGTEAARVVLAELLEEIRLPSEQDQDGNLWFRFGSARMGGHLWEDDRATYLTLTSPVLRDVRRMEGLAETLNSYNRSIHNGAFALEGSRNVVLTHTILIDDVSVEEFAYALVTIGELADQVDDDLKARFGGRMGME